MLGYLKQLRGFIPKLAKRLTRKRKARYGLSSAGVVKKSIDKRGRAVVNLGCIALNRRNKQLGSDT